MKLSLNYALILVCAAASCCAQSASSVLPPASSPESIQNPAGPGGIPSPSTPVSPGDQLPPKLKPNAEAKPSSKNIIDGKTSYVIGPLDVLIIKVWNNPNLSGLVDVAPDGMISLPLIGEVKADGLTARQLKKELAEQLTDYLNNPEVDVQIAKVNSKRYFVYGGVMRSGEFPLVQATTVMDALSIVGGFHDFANKKKIYVLRGTQKFFFNYKEVSKGLKMDQNILLQNGDRIFVPE